MVDGNIIDLSSDINAIKPSIICNCDISKENINLNKHIASFYGVKETNCLVYKNGNTLLHSLLNYFSDKYVTLYSPISVEYENIILQHNCQMDKINLLTNIDRAVQEKSIIFFTNPSFLFGKYYELDDFLEAWSKLSCKVIIDESFLEFSKKPSVSKYINKYENLYIIKNTSKLLGLKLFTFSTLIASKKSINNLSLKEDSDVLNIMEKQYFVDALGDKTFQNTFRAINIKNSLLLENILKESNLFEEIFPSITHMILCRVKEKYTESLKVFLQENKIIIHECTSYSFLNNTYLALNVSDDKNLKILKNVLGYFKQKNQIYFENYGLKN